MTVRDATPEDADGVAAVFAPYVRNSVVTFETVPPTPEEWRARIDGRPFVVLADDGDSADDTVHGYALASPWRPKPAYHHTVETTVYLAADRTGQGHGRRLLEELLRRCTKAGYRQAIAVIVDTGAGGSVPLHTAAGFRVAGRLEAVGHKQNRWLTTILMQRAL
jgi:L-amino acid N-acyltransferase YncA